MFFKQDIGYLPNRSFKKLVFLIKKKLISKPIKKPVKFSFYSYKVKRKLIDNTVVLRTLVDGKWVRRGEVKQKVYKLRR